MSIKKVCKMKTFLINSIDKVANRDYNNAVKLQNENKGGGKVFKNLEAEQKRYGYTNAKMAELLGISRVTYENKKKTGMFNRPQIEALIQLFNCKFEYLFADSTDDKSA